MNPLDALTGRLPMYRLVTLSLLVLVAVSLVLSATGALFYTPVELLASLLVTVGGSWAATRLLGIAFRIRPHGESAIITGLILFFLFLPTVDPVGLSVLALAASIGAASKFLIVRHGRHLFNPAAFAAVAVGLTGLGAAGWWVGTPALAPVVAVLGLLIVWRTRTLGIVLLFLALAVVLVTVQLMAGGFDAGSSVYTAIGSFPILFLGVFLLTEPLTLPPRRWQRFVVALVVAVFVALPVSGGLTIGTFSLSSEFAVLMGNVAAALLALPRGARLRFTGTRDLGAGTSEFAFVADRPVPVEAGQYVELHVPHAHADGRGTRRHLTVVSARDQELRVAVRVPEGRSSSFKKALTTLEPGSVVRLTSVAGDFVLPRDRSVPVLLVAGGIGVTPIVSQLERDAEHPAMEAVTAPRDAVVVYRAASIEAAAYLDRIASLAPVVLVTPTPPEPMPGNVRWAATLEEAFDDTAQLGERTAYISGTPTFVNRARRALRARGVRRIRTDHFSGY